MRSLLLAVAVASLVALPAPAEETPGTGELVATIGGAKVDLPVVSMDVDLAISGPIVRGHVVQTFENPTGESLDAEYVFPLPEGAAVDGLVLEVGGRRFVGTIQEKEEARKIFEQAKSEGKGAGLVEQDRPNLFRTKVANIPPHASVVVHLDTLDEAEWGPGGFSTVFPTTITARYTPGGTASCDPTASESAQHRAHVTLHASIDLGLPLDEVASPSHRVRAKAAGSRYEVQVGEGPVLADRDLELRWRPKAAAEALAGGVVEERPDGNYGLAILVPPLLEGRASTAFPTQTIFVVDVSGSMQGPSLEQAKAALSVALDRLKPGDTFDLIKFDSDNEAYSERLLPASSREIAAAQGWVSRLAAGSGTEILPALVRALDLSAKGDPSVLRRVILITDGAVGNEDEVVAEVGRRLGDSRLHIVGIGLAPNRYLMKALARAGRGTFESIGAIADVQSRTTELLERTERAAITDVALEWDGAKPLDADPDPVPDLYAGRPLVVTARFDPSRPLPKLKVWGHAPGGPVTMEADFAHAIRDAGIGTRWARARIASLEESRLHGADPKLVRADVVELSKRFSLVTAYTSFVVVADEAYEDLDECGEGELPQGGTDEPLYLAIGLALVVAGGALVAAARESRDLA